MIETEQIPAAMVLVAYNLYSFFREIVSQVE
jgi:hypothetical protein